MKKSILLLINGVFVAFHSWGQVQQTPEDIFVNALLQKMTIEEKAGQMTQVNMSVVAKKYNAEKLPAGERALDQAKLSKALIDCNVGSILNALEGRKNMDGWHEIVTDIQDFATKKTRLKIPCLIGVDAIHGATYIFGSTLFPHNIGIAATRNTALEKQSAIITALETKATGVKWNFDPVLDIGREPLWPRFAETYGEDVALCTAFGVAAVRGYEDNGIASCMKHFIGYSKPATGWDRTPSSIPEIELREYYLPQFKAAINAGAKTIMINSGEVNGIPTHGNRYLLTDVLRTELGFKGLVVSDWEDVIRLHSTHNVAKTPQEAVKMAVMAGVDMSMVPMDFSFYYHLVALIKAGEVPISRIDEAVKRILILKYQLGLFENPYPKPAELAGFQQASYKEVALTSALESMTLLKNEKDLLPIAAGKKILLAGPGANNKSSLHGCWSYSWQGDEEFRYPEKT
jgi:beta-glucosidase